VTFEYRLLAVEDDDAFQQVVGRTFRFDPGYWEIFQQRIGRENLRAVHDAGRLIGGLGFYRTAQWFGGRTIPCAAVAAVGVAPAARGGGAAAFLMGSLLPELHADGVPLATLYASTQRLYRKVGFEQAGSRTCYHLPMTSIGLRDRDLPVCEVSLDSPESLADHAQRQAQAAGGHLQRTSGLWDRGRCGRTDRPRHGGAHPGRRPARVDADRRPSLDHRVGPLVRPVSGAPAVPD
jgi:predicted acetyltransferase